MVQAMEAWIVADPVALAEYYGQGFVEGQLPKAEYLEVLSKADLMRGLDRATRSTRKGRYLKIRHASDLLKRIDANKVKTRCTHCERLFETLDRTVTAA